MSPKSKIVYLLFTTVFFIFANLYITDMIIQCGYKLEENPVFDITFIQNQGAAFNLFEGYKIFLITFSIVAFCALLFYAIKNIKKISVIGLFFSSLLLSGIFNNMLERVTFGYVRDFFKLNFINFPIFNISDIFINIGVFGLIFIILKNSYLKSNKTKNE